MVRDAAVFLFLVLLAIPLTLVWIVVMTGDRIYLHYHPECKVQEWRGAI